MKKADSGWVGGGCSSKIGGVQHAKEESDASQKTYYARQEFGLNQDS